MKYVIGLTGNIATGKSTVLSMLRGLGAEVIDADSITRSVMRRGQPVHQEVVAAFGSEILGPDLEINRSALGRRVFSDPTALRRLEQIVHPPTVKRIMRRIRRSPASVIVVEAIKLIESGMAGQLCHALWVVDAPQEQQMARLMTTRGFSRQEALQRIEAQPPQAEKVAAADVVIRNAGSLEETRRQVLDAWERIPTEFRRGASPRKLR